MKDHDHSQMPSHHNHNDHSEHAGHSVDMFRNKFWISLLLTIPTIIFSDTIMGWLNFSVPTFGGSQFIPAFFGSILFFYGGAVFIKSARSEIESKKPGMMSLISLAITVAFSYSLAASFGLIDGMDLWWELASLITIMLLGHWIEMASIQKAQGALNELAKLLPDTAELVTKDGTQIIKTSELKVGDRFLLRPGASIPADGKIIKGSSSINESMLTGESRLVNKKLNDSVIAGTINGSGSLTVRVSKAGDDTTLAGIMRLVDEAMNNKSDVQILADRAAFYLTFIAIISALLTAVGWLLLSDKSVAFVVERVVTVLVIACPHALGLAIPLVTAISTTKAAQHGLLIRNRAALENARQIDSVLFDKTGTLTKGEQGVIEVITSGSIDENSLIKIAASVELESEHSIAKAIVRYAKSKKINLNSPKDFSSIAGQGVKAKLNDKYYMVGGPNLIRTIEIELTKEIKEKTKNASASGKTIVYLSDEKTALGAFVIADEMRSESKEAVQQLQKSGINVAMVTGDSKNVADWVAGELGVGKVFSNVLPDDKSKIIKQLKKQNHKVAMIGDGVNDAPSLATADIGVAIGAGTDVAIESADIILTSNDPRGVIKIINLSKATYSKMIQNLIWATGYNILALPLAAGVLYNNGILLSPAIGAILMSLSTIIVAANAQLLRKIEI